MTDLSFLSWLDDLPENDEDTQPIEPSPMLDWITDLHNEDEYAWLDEVVNAVDSFLLCPKCEDAFVTDGRLCEHCSQVMGENNTPNDPYAGMTPGQALSDF